ncbi:methyltransferase domain-containing protein [Saccharopolyspora sp. MS10]|uniref:methyltransferase domain-containing protein n=1 Tax=Saccharopolyspora sp. MS10 TaxID=3385973 RepID=UPI00399F32B5
MTGFEPGLLGRRVVLQTSGGARIPMDVDRWRAESGAGDEPLLAACTGPTIDLGCGPGRLTAALTARGVVTLGVDISPVAVALTRRRGGSAVRRDLFDRLPGEGRWRHALLADGNIGIGGDPVALLLRVAELLAPGGTALVEVEPPGTGMFSDRVRLAEENGVARRAAADGRRPGEWFRWAWLDAASLARIAPPCGLAPAWTGYRAGRWFAALVRPVPSAADVTES